jgi:hypothetical protein
VAVLKISYLELLDLFHLVSASYGNIMGLAIQAPVVKMNAENSDGERRDAVQ